ncbi:MAG: hypothetical protein ABTQ34_09920 [Bdellovibrionales bacterium]
MSVSSFIALRVALLACVVLALTACNGTTVAIVGAATGIWQTRTRTPPPADLASQIPAHESWCYRTLAEPVCYTQPQDVPPDRLINVDPQNRYPLTRRGYYQALVENQK